MKNLITVFALLSISAAFSQEIKYESESKKTGNDAVLSVSDCNWPEIVQDTAGNSILRSQFSVNLCQETVTYKVAIHSDGKWFTWNDKKEIVDGSQVYTYGFNLKTLKETEVLDSEDIFQSNRVLRECRELRDAYKMQIGDVKNNCN